MNQILPGEIVNFRRALLQPHHPDDEFVPAGVVFPAKSDAGELIQVGALLFFKGPLIGNRVGIDVQCSGNAEEESAELLRLRIEEDSVVHDWNSRFVRLRALVSSQVQPGAASWSAPGNGVSSIGNKDETSLQ